jgi:hypothetical protein
MSSSRLSGFIAEVLGKEGLGDWRVDMWGCKGEGECDCGEKVI